MQTLSINQIRVALQPNSTDVGLFDTLRVNETNLNTYSTIKPYDDVILTSTGLYVEGIVKRFYRQTIDVKPIMVNFRRLRQSVITLKSVVITVPVEGVINNPTITVNKHKVKNYADLTLVDNATVKITMRGLRLMGTLALWYSYKITDTNYCNLYIKPKTLMYNKCECNIFTTIFERLDTK